MQNGVLQVSKTGSTTSVAVFLGAFTGLGGSTGLGDIFFEGDLRPGNSPGIVHFDNNITLGSGATLEIELGGTLAGNEYDRVVVGRSLSLGGTLVLSLIDDFVPQAGDFFDILDWETLDGTFGDFELPTLEGLEWNTSQLYTTGVLSVAAPEIAGDYNDDGVVNAADYVLWRDRLNSPTSLPNDATPGVDAGDYNVWKANFGAGAGPASSSTAAVPEPGLAALGVLATVLFGAFSYKKSLGGKFHPGS